MILTGSSEFFSSENSSDKDFIIFQEQGEVFRYTRNEAEKTCYFLYKQGISKAEYFDWLYHKNRWELNFAPLITREFLATLGIAIFGEDYEVVYEYLRRVFMWYYRFPLPPDYKFSKYIYRHYIYMRFIRAQSFELTKEDLEVALELKNGIYSKDALRAMFDFFGIGHLFYSTTKNVSFK
jgi:hypothetical protein